MNLRTRSMILTFTCVACFTAAIWLFVRQMDGVLSVVLFTLLILATAASGMWSIADAFEWREQQERKLQLSPAELEKFRNNHADYPEDPQT